ncbi:hypothetical protein M2171_007581 [Bradyrhizobium japonicum USDA 38]|nr:hypothetical protein [Bradyrhizobium japonicum USDA 38]MCS3941501.1 hypothetical protein [Bradyrhizobium japonicum]
MRASPSIVPADRVARVSRRRPVPRPQRAPTVTTSAGFARTTRTALGTAHAPAPVAALAPPARPATFLAKVKCRGCRKDFRWRSTRTAGGTEMRCDRSQVPSGSRGRRRRDRRDAPAEDWATVDILRPGIHRNGLGRVLIIRDVRLFANSGAEADIPRRPAKANGRLLRLLDHFVSLCEQYRRNYNVERFCSSSVDP